MDPVTLSLFVIMGYSLVGMVCKVIIRFTEPGPVPLDYNERWDNKKYVAMIHDTRALELENMGEVITVCECPVHVAKPALVPTARVPMIISPPPEKKAHIIQDGIRYPWPAFVPQHAVFSVGSVDYMSNTYNGHFKWFDEDGSQRGCRVLGLPAQPAEMIMLAKNIDYDSALLDYKVKAAYRAMKVGR